jgi:hypothetical protein
MNTPLAKPPASPAKGAPLKQEVKKSFVREYWYAFFFMGMFVLLAAAYIFRAFTPYTPVNVVQDNTWNAVTPGLSTLQDVQSKLGAPESVQKIDQGTQLNYKSIYPTQPNQVIANAEGKVIFIKENVDYNNKENLSTYIEKFGQPDFALFTPDGPLKSHVFLTKGIVIVAHLKDNSVEQKWFFEPTTKETFLQSWGKDLSDEESGPEPVK